MKLKGRFHAMILEKDPYSISNSNKLKASSDSWCRTPSSCETGHNVLISWKVKKEVLSRKTMSKKEKEDSLSRKNKLFIPVNFELRPAHPLQNEYSRNSDYSYNGYFHFDAGHLKDLKMLHMDSISAFCDAMMQSCGPIFKYHSIIPYDRYINDADMEELKDVYRRIIPNGKNDDFIEELLLLDRQTLISDEDWIIRKAEEMAERAKKRKARNESREELEE